MPACEAVVSTATKDSSRAATVKVFVDTAVFTAVMATGAVLTAALTAPPAIISTFAFVEASVEASLAEATRFRTNGKDSEKLVALGRLRQATKKKNVRIIATARRA
jgi:hypothetical protein